MATSPVNQRNVRSDGGHFTYVDRLAAWNKATPIPNCNPAVYRADRCGAPMRFADYGNVSSEFGWEIDHIFPRARGGTDNVENLQALHWKNNRGKGDNYPNWYCAVGAS